MTRDEKDKKSTNPLRGLLHGVASVAEAALAVPKAVTELAAMPNKIINHALSELANAPAKIVNQAVSDLPGNVQGQGLQSEWINPDEVDSGVDSDGQVVFLPIKDLQPNPNQPRKHFDADALQKLATSIKTRVVDREG